MLAGAIAVGAGATLAAGCGSNGGQADRAAGAAPAAARFTPAEFAAAPARGANRFLPLKPGTQWVRVGATDVGHRRVPHQVITTVTDVSRTVAGVRTVLVLDHEVDAGQVAQESLDYLAEDRRGNVWYLGTYTEEFEGGRVVSIRDAWLAGRQGARGGVLVPAAPRAGTPPFAIARPPGEDGDVAQIIRTGARRCVPFKCFSGVLVVREGKASAPDNELKYYAAGVGQIDNVPRSASQHRDVEKLVNLRRLTARGLAEASAEALTLDRHATAKRPGVFGPVAAKRTL